MLSVISTVICFVVLGGYLLRADRGSHARWMTIAFVLDMTLLLYVELSRSAIKTASQPPHPFVSFHIAISVLMVGLYFHQMYSGIRSSRSSGSAKPVRHRGAGKLFLALRSANLITGFFVSSFVRAPEASKENINVTRVEISSTTADIVSRKL